MKIRCVENSIRYRLRKSDIAELRSASRCSKSVRFGVNSLFQYTLKIEAIPAIAVAFNNGEIIISLPEKIFADWADTSEVAIAKSIKVDSSNNLELLIEKDFPCKDREEDVSDTFFELSEGDNC